jgi:hypothetical protein
MAQVAWVIRTADKAGNHAIDRCHPFFVFLS